MNWKGHKGYENTYENTYALTTDIDHELGQGYEKSGYGQSHIS